MDNGGNRDSKQVMETPSVKASHHNKRPSYKTTQYKNYWSMEEVWAERKGTRHQNPLIYGLIQTPDMTITNPMPWT